MSRRFGQCVSGATTIEYGLIAMIVSVAGALGMTEIGGQVDALFAVPEMALDAAATAGDIPAVEFGN